MQRTLGNRRLSTVLDHGAAATGLMFATPGALGNRAAAHLLAPPDRRRSLQRSLDEDFVAAGAATAKADDLQLCHEFAVIVSEIVDEVHQDLLAGRVDTWKGAKITSFLKLLMAQKPAALVHAGNVVEERVYAVMKARSLPAPWTAQFSAGMGGASFPDIVVNLGSEKEGLIDITSQRGHILGKAGGWTTRTTYVYLAEAYFPPVYAEHLPHILNAVKAGGVSAETVRDMARDVAEERAAKKEAAATANEQARTLYRTFGTFTKLVEGAYTDEDGTKHPAEAAAWMRQHGMGGYKGVPQPKRPKPPSEEQISKRRKTAQSDRIAKMTAAERKEHEERKAAQEEASRQKRAAKRAAWEDKYKDLPPEVRKLMQPW